MLVSNRSFQVSNSFLTKFGFRFRLISVMVGMLIVAFLFTYYFNLQAERQIEDQVDANIDALTDAFDIAQSSLSSNEYLEEIVRRSRIEEKFKGHQIHVLVVNDQQTIVDSSDGAAQIGKQISIPELPIKPGSMDKQISEVIGEATVDSPNERHTFIFPVVTTKGTYYLIIVLATQYVSQAIEDTANKRLAISMTIFGFAVILTTFLAYNFTKPIGILSRAVERVAAGDLEAEVPIDRSDEIGDLARTFNIMMEQLRNQRELEERLTQAEQSAIVGRLASGIAHEIRNPLNFINLSIDHVRSKYQPPDIKAKREFDSLLGSVKDEILRLNRIVTDFLHYGRPSKLSPKTISVRKLIDETVTLVKQKADDQGVTIEVSEVGNIREIRGDPEQLKSCFSNIIINGVQSMEFGGKLNVEIRNEPTGVRVNIRDTGTGIPAEALDRIFEPYYSTKETGVGLGLAVTKRIIEQHRGAINVTSEVGVGTEFSIFLPNTLQTGDLSLAGFDGGNSPTRAGR